MRTQLIELRDHLLLLGNEDYAHILTRNLKLYVYKYQIILLRDKDDSVFYGDSSMSDNSFYLEYIKEKLSDGTFDKLHDDSLLKYHEAGKPNKLAIKWQIDKSEYSAYFWFDNEKICSVFERFYGAHPDTRADFIIRIDAEKRKYELGLFRQGLKEPLVIPEEAYQLLVFKNKFEDYRSKNYNQERGAWVW